MHHLRGEFKKCVLLQIGVLQTLLSPAPLLTATWCHSLALRNSWLERQFHLGTVLTCPRVQMLALTLESLPPIPLPFCLVAGAELSHAFCSLSLPCVSEPPRTRSLALKSHQAWGKFPCAESHSNTPHTHHHHHHRWPSTLSASAARTQSPIPKTTFMPKTPPN